MDVADRTFGVENRLNRYTSVSPWRRSILSQGHSGIVFHHRSKHHTIPGQIRSDRRRVCCHPLPSFSLSADYPKKSPLHGIWIGGIFCFMIITKQIHRFTGNLKVCKYLIARFYFIHSSAFPAFPFRVYDLFNPARADFTSL